MVSQGLFTKWSIVYDITNMQIYFKIYETPTIVGEKKIFLKQPPYDPAVKVVYLSGFDFSGDWRTKGRKFRYACLKTQMPPEKREAKGNHFGNHL
jgi:hypothetical protein